MIGYFMDTARCLDVADAATVAADDAAVAAAFAADEAADAAAFAADDAAAANDIALRLMRLTVARWSACETS
jgi:hypothetical protein